MSAKPLGYSAPRMEVLDVVVITLNILALVRKCLLHEWSGAISVGIFLFVFWCWSLARRETEAWQSWYDRARGVRAR